MFSGTTPEPIRDLDLLMRAVLKYIYVYDNKWHHKSLDPMKESMSLDEVRQMQYSIVWWQSKELKRLKDKIDKKIIFFRATADEVDQDEYKLLEEKLRLLGWMLSKNELGKFDKRKEEFYYKSIDWKKFHRLPGSYTNKDFIIAADALNAWNKLNPELA